MLKIRQIPTPVSIYHLSNALSNNIRMHPKSSRRIVLSLVSLSFFCDVKQQHHDAIGKNSRKKL